MHVHLQGIKPEQLAKPALNLKPDTERRAAINKAATNICLR